MLRSRFAPLNILVAIVGAALLVLTVQRVGWSSVVSGITSVGWWFIAVVLLGEPVTARLIAGGALTLCGVLIIAVREKRLVDTGS